MAKDVFSRLNVIALCGDQKIVPRNQVAYDDVTDRLNVKGGQIMFYDKSTNLTIDKTDVATATEITAIVGIGKTGSTPHCWFELTAGDIDLCRDQFDIKFQGPNCSTDSELAIEVGCIQCDSSYPLEITVSDPRSREFYGHEFNTFYLRGTTRCKPGCDPTCSCSKKFTCYDLACKYYEDVKSWSTNITVCNVEFDNQNLRHVPFVLIPLQAGDLIYRACLPQLDDECCAKCAGIAPLGELTITPKGEGQDPLVINFDGFGDGKIIMKDELDALQEYLDKKLECIKGGAVITGGHGCCPVEIKFAGCIDSVEWAGIELCEEDPFRPQAVEAVCGLCGPKEDETHVPGCLILVWMKGDRGFCACNFPADVNLDENRRSYIHDVNFIGEDWTYGYQAWYHTRKYDTQQGTGYDWIMAAMQGYSHSGGRGNFKRYGGHLIGKFKNRTLEGQELYKALTNLKCDVDYCETSIVMQRAELNHRAANGVTTNNKIAIQLLNPIGDKDTAIEVQEMWEEIHKRNSACRCFGKGCYEDCDGEEIDYTAVPTCDDKLAAGELEPEADPKAKKKKK